MRPTLKLSELESYEQLRGVWELCQSRPGVLHAVGMRAEEQCKKLNNLDIDWEKVSG